MPATSKRLEFLTRLTSPGGSGSADPFAWYGLAMELRALERHDDALAAFQALRERTPDYVPMYLMCGQMLAGGGRGGEARAWLEAGVIEARKKGDEHAAGELESALGTLA